MPRTLHHYEIKNVLFRAEETWFEVIPSTFGMASISYAQYLVSDWFGAIPAEIGQKFITACFAFIVHNFRQLEIVPQEPEHWRSTILFLIS